MRALLYLPFYQTGDFANNEKEISDEEYVDMLNQYYSSDYYRFMTNAINGFFDDRYQMMEVIPEKYKIAAIKEKVTPTRYFTFEIDLNDIEDQPTSGFYINSLSRSRDMSALIIHIHPDEGKNSDGLSELSFWVRESNQIMLDPRINEDRKLGILQPKDLRISFEEDINGISYSSRYELKGCRIVEQDDRYNFAIIINKIAKI